MVVNESVMQWFEENKIWDWDLVFIKESWISEFPGLFGRYIFVFAEEKDAMLFALRWS